MNQIMLSSFRIVLIIASFSLLWASGAHAQGGAMLAVVNDDGNIAIYDANGKNPVPVTTDANPNVKIYHWPTWSTDGRLAFFSVSVEPADPYRLRVYVIEKPGDKPVVAYSSKNETFTYAYWAPGDCPDTGGKCRDLALLFTPPTQNGLAVRMIRDVSGKFTDSIIGEAAPFYYSFSPDGQKMFWHRFAAQLEIYDIKGERVDLLDDSPGAFQAPMWSPIGEQLLFAVNGSAPGLADLIIADGALGPRTAILKDQPEPVTFAWSPDGTRIASVARDNKLLVTDARTGANVATSQQGSILAHFWSPQSDRLAYLTITRDPNSTTSYKANGRGNGMSRESSQQLPPSLTWYLLDIKTQKTIILSSFIPTREMVYYLNFFDQFARSHSFWSPDGRYIAYGAMESGGSSVLLVDTQKVSNPVRVGNGVIGIWSWR